jgi:hypothetical protein
VLQQWRKNTHMESTAKLCGTMKTEAKRRRQAETVARVEKKRRPKMWKRRGRREIRL